MKKILGEILTLGAYEDYKKLSLKEKVLLPLGYIGLLSLFVIF